MSLNISRRDFIKKSSIAAAAVSTAPVTSFASSKKKRQDLSRVVITTDHDCMSGTTFDADRIQDMVDYAIMHLTGVPEKAKAYEALFPEPVTKETTIAIKKNSVSAGSKNKSWPYVRDALVNGLCYMCDGEFPEDNITVTTGGSTNNGPEFDVGSRTYTIKDPWVESDWIINAPVCWAHGTGHGITMGLKNMMSAVGGSSLSNLHDYATDEDEPWMSILNSQPTFKDKQVLVLLDAISGRSSSGPGQNAEFYPHCVVASTDMVAGEYQGLEIIVDNGLSSSREQSARKVLELAEQSPYELGTDDPDEMEVIYKEPPWEDPTLVSSKSTIQNSKVQVRMSTHAGGARTTFILPSIKGTSADLSIFNVKGKHVWQHRQTGRNRIVWSGKDTNGNRVSPGKYVYTVKIDRQTFTGTFQILQ